MSKVNKQLLNLIRMNNKGVLFVGLVLYLVCISFSITVPYITSKFIDSISSDATKDMYFWMLMIIVFWALEQIVGFVWDLVKGKSEIRIWESICKRCKKNVLFFDANRRVEAKDISQQLGQSYELIKDFFFYYPIKFIGMVIETIGIVVMLVRISTPNAMIIMLFVPCFIVSSSIYGEKLSKNGKKTVDSMSDCRVYLTDVSKVALSERFNQKSSFIPFDDLLKRYSTCKKKQVVSEAVFSNFLSYALMNLLISVSLITSGILVYQGKQSVGELFAVQLYASHFWTPIEFFVDAYKRYLTNKNIIGDFFEFLNRERVEYINSAIDSIRLVDYIALSEVGEKLHLPINVKFEKGKIYVVLGRNGIGKTSLVHSMLGLNSNYAGEIVLNGYGNNSDFTYAQAEPIYSSFFGRKISAKSSMGQLKINQLQTVFSEESTVYLLDEPSNYLDEEKKGYLREQLDCLKLKNKIVIVITHDRNLIEEDDVVINLVG